MPSRLTPSLCQLSLELSSLRHALDLSELSLCHSACQHSCRPLTPSVLERACRVATRWTRVPTSARPCLSAPLLPQLLRVCVWSGRDFWRCCESHAAALIDVWEMPCSYFTPHPPLLVLSPFLVLTLVLPFTGTFFFINTNSFHQFREKKASHIFIFVWLYIICRHRPLPLMACLENQKTIYFHCYKSAGTR